MDQDATWYGVGLGQGDFVLDGDPAPPLQKGGGAAPTPNFRPMFIVAKRTDGSRRHLAWREAAVQATLCWMGTQPSSPKRGRSPFQLSASVRCGQTPDRLRCHLVWR